MARRGAVLALAATALVVAACSSDGRTLHPPKPGATAPVIVTTTTAAPDGGDGAVIAPVGSSDALLVASSAFTADSAIPVDFTCDASAPKSPPLSWTGVPVDAAELAIVVTDPDANGFVHWVVGGLSPELRSIAEGALPEGAIELANDAGTVGWTGPCPPKGDPAHHYVFSVYALANPIGLTAGGAPHDGIGLINDASIEAATLVATYQRPA